MLTYITWNPDPKLVDFGFLALRWYSLLFAAGFVLGYLILKNRFQKENVELIMLDRLTIYVVLGTLTGARLGHCLFYDFTYYRHHLAEVFLPVQFSPHFKITGYQGLASHGGAIGVLTAVLLFSRKYHINFLWITDKLALAVPFAGCCIRLGNLMNSEIIGKPTHFPWAFIFIRVDDLPRHPAQLYEAITYLLIGVVMWLLARKSQKKAGYIFGWFLLLLFSARFGIEFCKEDQSEFEAGMLFNMGQLLSIPLIITGIVLIVLNTKKVKVEAVHLQHEN
jgi:prolipoprotein diacylglyceryl transferase